MRTYFKILALVGVIISTLFITKVSYADPAPGIPSFSANQTFAFTFVAESGDLLVMGPMILDWDPDVYNTTQAKVLLTPSASNTAYPNYNKDVPNVTGSLVGWYLDAATVTALGIVPNTTDIRLLVTSSGFDNTVDSGSDGNAQWVGSASIAETRTNIEDRLFNMVASLQYLYPDTAIVTGQLISAAGAQLAANAYQDILIVAPDSFSIRSDQLNETYDPDTNALKTLLDGATNPFKVALYGNGADRNGLGYNLGVNAPMLAFFIILGLSISVIIAVRKVAESTPLGLACASGLLVWWASLSLMPIEIVLLLDVFMVLAIGIWAWRSIPTI